MTRIRIAASAAAALILLNLAASVAALAAGPEENVNAFHETLISTMRDGRRLGESGRYGRIEPVIRRLFDLPLMSRLAIGSPGPRSPRPSSSARLRHSAPISRRPMPSVSTAIRANGSKSSGSSPRVQASSSRPASSDPTASRSVLIMQCVRMTGIGRFPTSISTA
jgi:hypothetical protein